jgi:NADH:quinone reductase (non-electrogenic)
MSQIVVVGGGFAGQWTSLAAVRELELAGGTGQVDLVSADPFLVLRPRLYEADPAQMRIDLRPILDTAGVRLITEVATGIDNVRRRLLLADGAVPFDRQRFGTSHD